MSSYIFRKIDGSTVSKWDSEFFQDVYDSFLVDSDAESVLQAFASHTFNDKVKKNIIGKFYEGASEFLFELKNKFLGEEDFDVACSKGWTYEGAVKMCVMYLRYCMYVFLISDVIAQKLETPTPGIPYLPSGYTLTGASGTLNYSSSENCFVIGLGLTKTTKTAEGQIKKSTQVLQILIKNFKTWVELNGPVISSNLNEEYVDINLQQAVLYSIYKENVMIKDIDGKFLKELIK